MKTKPRPWTFSEIQLVRQNLHLSNEELAELTDRSVFSLRCYLSKNGIKRPKARPSPQVFSHGQEVKDAEVLAFYTAHSAQQVANRFGIDRNKVFYIAERNGFSKKRQALKTPKLNQPCTIQERKLRQMKGREFIVNAQYVRVEGYTLTEDQVIIQTNRRPYCFPVDQIMNLSEVFLPMIR